MLVLRLIVLLRVTIKEFRGQGFRSLVYGSRFTISGLGFEVQGSGFRFRVCVLGVRLTALGSKMPLAKLHWHALKSQNDCSTGTTSCVDDV